MSTASLLRALALYPSCSRAASPGRADGRQRLAQACPGAIPGRGSFRRDHPRGGSLPHDHASGGAALRLNG